MKIDGKLLTILIIFFIWRILLQAITYLSPQILEYKSSFAGANLAPLYSNDKFIYAWANFDGAHYLTIVTSGYEGYALIQAFFPLYPILIKLCNFFINNPVITGLFISNLFLVFLLYIWFHFFEKIYSKKIAFLSLYLFLIFPTSFYLTAYYSESLFLFLILTSFIFAQKKRWYIATLFAFFATSTRLVGAFLVLALYVDVYASYTSSLKDTFLIQIKKVLKTRLPILFTISLGFFGLGLYSLYLYFIFNDPLYFYHVQADFKAGREESIILLPQVLWRYTKIMLTANPHTLSYYNAALELLLSLGALGIIFLGFLKRFKIPYSWTLFSLGAFILPTLTGTFSSMPRYVLVCFPIFLILAQLLEKKPVLIFLYSIISISLLVINTILFIQGYWVA